MFTETKTSCLPKLKSIAVLLDDFLTMNENFLNEVMFKLSTFSQVLATVILKYFNVEF